MEEVKKLEKDFENFNNMVKESLNKTFIENLVKDNKVEFEHKGQVYRVRQPSFKEKQEVYRKKAEKYFELFEMKDSNGKHIYKLESDLRKLYKEERNIDIDELDKKFTALETKRKSILEKLGEVLHNKGPENEREAYKKEIEELEKQQVDISSDKGKLLEYSLENQLMLFLYSYISYLTAEKLIKKDESGDVWVKAWETYEVFEQSEEALVATVTFYASLLMNSENL